MHRYNAGHDVNIKPISIYDSKMKTSVSFPKKFADHRNSSVFSASSDLIGVQVKEKKQPEHFIVK